MADIELIIKIPEGLKKDFESEQWTALSCMDMKKALENGTPLTPKVLADLLMEERIRGELKQDVSYSKNVIDDVRCRLTVDIIDHRPCYCGAELGAEWKE